MIVSPPRSYQHVADGLRLQRAHKGHQRRLFVPIKLKACHKVKKFDCIFQRQQSPIVEIGRQSLIPRNANDLIGPSASAPNRSRNRSWSM